LSLQVQQFTHMYDNDHKLDRNQNDDFLIKVFQPT
jgi:hypothetical protein